MKLGKLLALVGLSFIVHAHAMGDESPTSTFDSLRSEKVCNSYIARKAIKKKCSSYSMPKGDGTAPWPRLYGAWVNSDRGVVVVIKSEEIFSEGRARDVVRVRIHHLCSSALMAEGSRLIEKSDYKNQALVIRLRNVDQSIPYPYFDSSFTLVKDNAGAPMYVDTQMISPLVDNQRMNDRFKLIQP